MNQAVLSLVILDKIQSQPVNQKKRTHIFQEAANRYVNWWRATTVWNFLPLTPKSTSQQVKWRPHSWIFSPGITSQPVNPQLTPLWNATQLNFFSSKKIHIPSQPVNHWKRTHIFQEADQRKLKPPEWMSTIQLTDESGHSLFLFGNSWIFFIFFQIDSMSTN